MVIARVRHERRVDNSPETVSDEQQKNRRRETIMVTKPVLKMVLPTS